MRPPLRVSPVAVFLFVLGAVGPVWADAIILSDARSTRARASLYPWGGSQIVAEQIDAAEASGATFQYAAHATISDGDADAHAMTFHESFVNGTVMSGVFDARGGGNHGEESYPNYGSGSGATVTFLLEERHSYQFSAFADWSGLVSGDGLVWLTGTGVDHIIAGPGLGAFWEGILAPGTYRLLAYATAGGGEYSAGSAEFALNLSRVPEPGFLLLIGLGVLGACGWRKAQDSNL